MGVDSVEHGDGLTGPQMEEMAKHGYSLLRVANLVNDSARADADSPSLPTRQLETAGWSWVFGQRIDGVANPRIGVCGSAASSFWARRRIVTA